MQREKRPRIEDDDDLLREDDGGSFERQLWVLCVPLFGKKLQFSIREQNVAWEKECERELSKGNRIDESRLMYITSKFSSFLLAEKDTFKRWKIVDRKKSYGNECYYLETIKPYPPDNKPMRLLVGGVGIKRFPDFRRYMSGCCTEVSGDKFIKCTACKKWWHHKCAGMSDEQFKLILDTPDIQWKCKTCSSPSFTMSQVKDIAKFIRMVSIDPASVRMDATMLCLLESVMPALYTEYLDVVTPPQRLTEINHILCEKLYLNK